MGEPITSFRGPYMFLSNFYRVWITYEGIAYPTSEHAYQAAKTANPLVRASIAALREARDAKRYGADMQKGRAQGPFRPEFHSIKLQIMLDILRIKFSIPMLREKLLETEDRLLEEGNWWGDTYWGVSKGVGENHLGRLLMQVREELRHGR